MLKADVYFEYAVVGMIDTDSTGKILRVNAAAASILGHEAKALRDMNLKQLVAKSSMMAWQIYMSWLAAQGMHHLELFLTRADGHEILVDFSSVQVDDDLIVHVFDDVTLKRIAESRMSAVADAAVDAVVSIDEQGLVQLFNPSAERMFGWRAVEIIGKNVSLLMPEPFASAHDGFIQRFLSTHNPKIIGTGREVIALRKDGSTFPAHLSVGHHAVLDGHSIFVGFVSDISQQKQNELALLRAKEDAETAVKAKAEFLANMSHEIRTPMNAIIGFAELSLQDNKLDENNREYISTILSAGRHLLGIVNNILDFSKAEANKIVLEQVCFHLPNMLRDVINTLSINANQKGLALGVDIAHNVSVRVLGDPQRLQQVLLNLLGNAIKFTQQGKVELFVSMKPDVPDAICFVIQDTGIGMNEEQLSKLFKPFSQADTSISRQYGGTGLGTAICKQLVEAMGGEIQVDSAVGEGTTVTFYCRLPVSSHEEACLFDTVSYTVQDYVSPRCFKVLLAEDIEANATLVRLRLEHQGHQVHWVADGRLAATAVCTSTDFDVVLMDLQMPEMDGIRAAHVIRQCESEQQRKPVPILALTASVFSDEQRRCLEAGMSGVIAKPINFTELLVEMERVVPAGEGYSSTKKPARVQKEIDFSVVEQDVNVSNGLMLWREPQAYCRALHTFAQQHENDALHIRANLEVGCLERAQYLSHALKGLSGNLALNKIYTFSNKIDQHLKNRQIVDMDSLVQQLHDAIQSACTAIARLPQQDDQYLQIRTYDADKVEPLLKILLDVLDQLNPELAVPILEQLEPLLGASKLQPIYHALELFDFDSAKEQVQQLLAD